jgi:predicted DNA-binding transcriptional regulator AlpA
MVAHSSALVKLSPGRAEQLDLGLFDHLITSFPKTQQLLRADQVAKAMGWSRSTVYNLIEEGLLEAHELPDRDRKNKLVTKRSVARLIAATANYEPKDFGPLLELILPTLSKEQLVTLSTAATRERMGRA